MGQIKKKYMRRKVAQAIKYQMMTVDCLLELRELFTEFHPEWDEYFTMIANGCIVTIGFVKKLAIQAWGYFPDNYENWLR